MRYADEDDARLTRLLANPHYGWWVADGIRGLRRMTLYYNDESSTPEQWSALGKEEIYRRRGELTILTGAFVYRVVSLYPEVTELDVWGAIKGPLETDIPSARARYDRMLAEASRAELA